MKNDTPFGVVLIRDGGETGPAETFDVGTFARIADWYQGSDGLLGVTAVGEQRFRLLSASRQKDGLNIGTVETIPDESDMPLPGEFRSLATILEKVLDDLGRLYESLQHDYENGVWVGYRFVEILPIDLDAKQQSLESSDTLARLKLVDELLHSVPD